MHCDSTCYCDTDLEGYRITFWSRIFFVSGRRSNSASFADFVSHKYKRVFGNSTWSFYLGYLLSGGPTVPNVKK